LGTVALAGDATSVALVSGSARFAVGDVPPGSYTIEATFPGMEPVVAGRLDVVAGGQVTLTCQAVFTRCSAR
jgi:hypothetical protein